MRGRVVLTCYLPQDTTWLLPGQRLVIDGRQFLDGTSLSNGGETIALTDANGAVIRSLRYDDLSPWPTGADGFGFSIVLVSPEANPDHSEPSNWKRGVRLGGTPSEDDPEERFSGDPNADADGDDLTAIVEFSLGNSDTAASDATPLSLTKNGQGSTIISFPINPQATGLRVHLEQSTDLANWTVPRDASLIGIHVDDLHRHIESWSIPAAIDTRYLRLRITNR